MLKVVLIEARSNSAVLFRMYVACRLWFALMAPVSFPSYRLLSSW
jgi:hypothetical protein